MTDGLLIRRWLREIRTRTIVFGALFLIYGLAQAVGFRQTYPSAADRAKFAASFGDNAGLRLLYGRPYAIASVPGYTEWRVGGVLAIVAAIFGVLVAVRLLRTEEDCGRTEFLLAGAISRAHVFASVAVAVLASVLALAVAEFAGLALGGIAVGGAALMSLTTALVGLVCAGLGAMAAQVAPTARAALGIGSGIAGIFLVLRAVSDMGHDARWLDWCTPLGWAELVRPLTAPRPAPLVLPVLATAAVVLLARSLAAGRDLGSGLLRDRDRVRPRLRLLGSPLAQTVRAQRGVVAIWGVTIVIFMFVFGLVSKNIATTSIPAGVAKEVGKLGAGSLTTSTGYLSFVFLFTTVALCLFAAAQAAAIRVEESAHLETLLAQPVARTGWLAARVTVALGAVVALAVLTGLSAWAGASVVGVHIGLGSLLLAGVNMVPVTVLFLGVGALGFGLVPRACAGVAYGAVALSFLWQLVAELVSSSHWLQDLSPFAHVALVPTQHVRGLAAFVLVLLGLIATGFGMLAFTRRDTIGE